MFVGKITRTIKKYCMLESGEGVVVGVSGGPDSMALLYILYFRKAITPLCQVGSKSKPFYKLIYRLNRKSPLFILHMDPFGLNHPWHILSKRKFHFLPK